MPQARGSHGYLEIARAGDTIFVRGHGQCEAALCHPLRELVGELDEGTHRMVFDLAHVTGMDSTFMGVLLGFQRLLVEQGGRGVTLANATPHCTRQMTVLGLTRFIEVVPGAVEFPRLETTILGDEEVSDEERIRLVKEAHERLVEVDEQNEARFGALLSALDRALGD
jgi:anti-anti-sigma factor